MHTYLETFAQTVVGKLKKTKTDHPEFVPHVYVGKTNSFQESYGRHFNEGYPALLRVAEGTPEEVSMLEDILIRMLKQDGTWHLDNKNEGSGGNVMADKIYICFDSSVKEDTMNEYGEEFFLGKEYPVDLKDLRE